MESIHKYLKIQSASSSFSLLGNSTQAMQLVLCATLLRSHVKHEASGVGVGFQQACER